MASVGKEKEWLSEEQLARQREGAKVLLRALMQAQLGRGERRGALRAGLVGLPRCGAWHGTVAAAAAARWC